MATTPSEAADVVGDVPNGPRPSLRGEEIMRVPFKLKGSSGYLVGSSPAYLWSSQSLYHCRAAHVALICRWALLARRHS